MELFPDIFIKVHNKEVNKSQLQERKQAEGVDGKKPFEIDQIIIFTLTVAGYLCPPISIS